MPPKLSLTMPGLDPDKTKIDDFIRTIDPKIPRFDASEIPRASSVRFPESAFGTGYISEDGRYAVKIMNLKQRIGQTSVDNIIESLKSELINYYAITQICPNSFCKLFGYHYDILNSTLIIVMENCGTDLVEMYDNILSEIRLNNATNHIGQIINILQCLHENGFVHFDIKPENVVLHGNTIKLIDAGSLVYTRSIGDIYVRGTRFYMAPELQGKTKISNSVDLLSTDIYSLGVLFLFMIIPSGRVREQLLKNMNESMNGIIKNWLKRVFGEAIEFKNFFGEPVERLTIQKLKSMYEQTHGRTRKLDEMTSGGINTRKTHKRRSNKRRSNKRRSNKRKHQRKSKSKSRRNK